MTPNSSARAQLSPVRAAPYPFGFRGNTFLDRSQEPQNPQSSGMPGIPAPDVPSLSSANLASADTTPRRPNDIVPRGTDTRRPRTLRDRGGVRTGWEKPTGKTGENERGGRRVALTWTLVALRATTLVMEEAMQAILESGWRVCRVVCVREWRGQLASRPTWEPRARKRSQRQSGDLARSWRLALANFRFPLIPSS
jgi:hypothetical protein